MKERPILFTGCMVRAILDGRKTVTRRAVKPWQLPGLIASAVQGDPKWMAIAQRGPRYGFAVLGETEEECAQALATAGVCPIAQIGDRLWVRESWVADAQVDQIAPRDLSQGEPILYPADGGTRQTGCSMISPGRTRPSIHMPRWVSRIQLEVVSVRVERLQAGEGETDFESRYLAEGINRIHHGDGEYYYHAFNSEPEPENWWDPFYAWRELWTSINGEESWEANPWVWVVEFKRVPGGGQ